MFEKKQLMVKDLLQDAEQGSRVIEQIKKVREFMKRTSHVNHYIPSGVWNPTDPQFPTGTGMITTTASSWTPWTPTVTPMGWYSSQLGNAQQALGSLGQGMAQI